ncbi:hypothetical protein [Vibrio sp. H11]|uniref:hypothetical protein n=1 Tax=Vibrio sp. H11 TaxID=2565928 RepID=UPI0010A6483D|nr:hypothetical protein [Vibrio sp. H11]
MADFQYYFEQLPCFNCKKTTVSTDLGWLTAAMKADVQAQVAEITAQDGLDADIAVNVTCTKDEARDYLLLNFYGYFDEELADQVEADDEKEVADEIAELLEAGSSTIVFEHEIALQSCTACDVDAE